MIVTITLLSALSLLANGYIIANYTKPPAALADIMAGKTDITPVAYPLNVCLNYEVAVAQDLSGINKFGRFTCNGANDEVTFTPYSDYTCTAGNEVTAEIVTYAYDAALPAGSVGEFDCTAAVNYALAYSCTVDYVTPPASTSWSCCSRNWDGMTPPATCLPQVFATGVCILIDSDNSIYNMDSCDTMTIDTEVYIDDACTTPSPLFPVPILSAKDDECGYYDTLAIYDIYRTAVQCISAGMPIILDSLAYCEIKPSSSPTMEPTTAYPSESPTTAEPTEAPIEATASMDDSGACQYGMMGLFVVAMFAYIM